MEPIIILIERNIFDRYSTCQYVRSDYYTVVIRYTKYNAIGYPTISKLDKIYKVLWLNMINAINSSKEIAT